jgi:F-type H+-transporting ATPase subunit epsilon
MGALQITVVTAEREVFSGEADVVILPGADGELAILPSHTPLVTVMNPGELWIQDADREDALALSGGFMEVRNNRISILADTAERADEIDEARAEDARERAQLALRDRPPDIDPSTFAAALRQSQLRLKVARRRRRRGQQSRGD